MIMTREIKFRSKSLDGIWEYGELHLRCNHPHIHNLIGAKIYIDPNTVGQFTGLHDKNGKEIYEGDIIKMSTAAYGDEIFKIGYEDSHIGAFCLCTNEQEDTSRFVGIFGRDYGYEPFYCEVIGNIYDNPELLKQK